MCALRSLSVSWPIHFTLSLRHYRRIMNDINEIKNTSGISLLKLNVSRLSNVGLQREEIKVKDALRDIVILNLIAKSDVG